MSAHSPPPTQFQSLPPSGSGKQLEKVLALHTFTAENDDELSFAAGEYVWVLEKDEVYGDGWWKGRNQANSEGLFPASYILPDGVDPSPYLAMQSGNGGLGPEETMPSPPSPSSTTGTVGESGRFAALGNGATGTGPQTTAGKAEALGPAEIAAAHVGHQASPSSSLAKPRTLSISPSRSPPARRTSAIDDMKNQVQAALDENARASALSSAVSPAMSQAGTSQSATPANLNVGAFPNPPTPNSAAGQGDASGRARTVSDVMPTMPGTASTTSFLTEEGGESITSHEDERAAGAGDVRTRLAESARLENLKREQEAARETEEKRRREEGLGLGLTGDGGAGSSLGSNNGNANGPTNGGLGGFKVPNGIFGGSSNGNNPKTGVRMSAGAGMASGLVYSDESDASDSDEEDQRELDKRLSGRDSIVGGAGLTNASSMSSPRGNHSKGMSGRLGDDDGFGWSGAAANAFGVKTPQVDQSKEFQQPQPQVVSPLLRSSVAVQPPIPATTVSSPPSEPVSTFPAQKRAPTSPQGFGGALPPFPASVLASRSESPSSAPTPKPHSNHPGSYRQDLSPGPPADASRPQSREDDRTPLASVPKILAPVAIRSPHQLQPSFLAMDESPGGTAYVGPSEGNESSVPEYDPMAAKGAELATERDLARVEATQSKSMAPPPAPVASLQRQASTDFLPSRPASGSPGVHRNWGDIPGDPHLWSVQQVTEWAQRRGFDQGICDRFAENEVDGEVLLSLDVNLLKELDIPQFGKRIKISNAINELRRPGSNISAGQASEARSSRQIASGYNGGQGLTYNRPGSTTSAQSPLAGPGYPSSPTYGGYADSQPSHSRNVSMGGPALVAASEASALGYDQPRKPSEGSNAGNNYAEWAHGKAQSRKASAHDSFKGINTPIREEDENGKLTSAESGAQFVTPEARPTETMPTFAAPVSTPHTATTTTTSSSIRSRNSSVPPSPSTPNTKRSSLERGPSFAIGHKKDKSLGDRTSFFGARSRKPAPRFPSSASNIVVDRPSTDMGQSPTGKSGIRSMIGRNGNQRVSGAPSLNTSMVSAPTSPARTNLRKEAPGTTVASAVSKIGTPDYSGFMKKKGENYRSWKLRYFVLKGSHLYYMRNESEEKIKGHIDLQGYKVMADTGAGAGSYGFQIVHDRSPAHSFSSNEQRVVKEWMKQLMKATITRDYSAPVVSSCNIPTIPLKEAQALQPRPPSPGEREATQRATRRENPNQLTARDASVLMSLDNSPSSPTQTSTNRNSAPPGSREPKSPSFGRKSGEKYVRNASISSVAGLGIGAGAYSNASSLPPRPSRDARMASNASSVYPQDGGGATPRPTAAAPSFGGGGLAAPMTYTSPAPDTQAHVFSSSNSSANDGQLLAWVNSHLPSHETMRAVSIPASFVSGQLITRVIEYFVAPPFPPPSNPSSSMPANAEQFEPIGSEANLEGLFTMMDKAIDEGMDTGGVSINDVRMGREVEIRRLVESLRAWGEAKKAEVEY